MLFFSFSNVDPITILRYTGILSILVMKNSKMNMLSISRLSKSLLKERVSLFNVSGNGKGTAINGEKMINNVVLGKEHFASSINLVVYFFIINIVNYFVLEFSWGKGLAKVTYWHLQH